MNAQDLLTIATEIIFAIALYISVKGFGSIVICDYCKARYRYKEKQVLLQTRFLMAADYNDLLKAASERDLLFVLPDRKKTTLARGIALYQLV